MPKSPFFLALPLFLTASGGAQTLPAPAPQPVRPSAPAHANVAPLESPFLEAPLSSESPIVIGEPVRRQNGVTPTPQAPKKSRASVAGVSIAGLSDAQAVAKLRGALAAQLKEPVRLVIGDYQYTFTREELGAQLPLWPLMRQARARNGAAGLRLQIDQKMLLAALGALDAQVRQDFENSALDVGASAARVKTALESAPISSSVALAVIAAPRAAAKAPEAEKTPVSTPSKSDKYGYLLAAFSTRYDASLRGRTTNLKMAAKLIDGTVVAPGKVFSTNLAIGPRNAAAGWREAKMFVSGRVVSGTGAGICQAASTLYNAALLSDLPIVERHAHSMRVTYVAPSRDAALMWGSKDFKFRNTTSGAIRVQTWVAGGKFHARLWGEKPSAQAPVQIVSRVLSRQGGTRSEAFKLVGGQKIRLSRDLYAPLP
ncbi:MAG: VanW family protein [Armatimonadetes bacterium]|nr:VanW family protein [Armatimonadota bacterium]